MNTNKVINYINKTIEQINNLQYITSDHIESRVLQAQSEVLTTVKEALKAGESGRFT